MTLDEIRWMAELFETRKMTVAAEKLFITQPALSQCLQRVEQQLGFQLFQRSRKGMVPTEKGTMFYEMAKTVNSAYDSFLRQAAFADQTQLHEIVIGMPPYLSSKASTDILIQLKEAFPEILFSIYESSASELQDAVRKNTAQLMITSEPVTPAEMVAHQLTKMDSVIFLRSGSKVKQFSFVKNGKKYLDPVYLKDEPITITKAGQASHALAISVFHECGIEPQIRHETGHVSTLFKNAKVGISSSVGPCTQAVKEFDSEGTVIYFIPEKYKCSKTKVVAYALPEIDKKIPPEVFHILKQTISKSGVYYSSD